MNIRAHAGRRGVILVPYAWLGLFFALPCLIVLKISFAEQLIAQPPYSPASTGRPGRPTSPTC